MTQFAPLVAFVAVVVALVAAAVSGHLPPADLVRDLLLLCLPGAGAAARSLMPPALPPEGVRRLPVRPGEPVVLALLLGGLCALSGCASWPEWRAALTACGVQLAPAGVQTGVALAIHRGEGWAEALTGLVSTYGDCLVRAEVLRHLQGEGPPPPTPAAIAAVAPVLESGGELSARRRLQPPAVVQARARQWLESRR